MNNRRHQRNQNEYKAFHRFILGTFILALVFSAGLIVGQRIASGESPLPLVAAASTPPPAVVTVIDTGEEHLGTDYSFYELLGSREDSKSNRHSKKNKNVTHRAPSATTPKPEPKMAPVDNRKPSPKQNSGKFTLQVGSHTNLAEANKEIAALKSKGLQPFVTTMEQPNRGTFYRVRVGRFATIADARKAQKNLEEKERVPSFVAAL